MKEAQSPGHIAFNKFLRDKIGVLSCLVVFLYFAVAFLVFFDLIATNWDALIYDGYSPTSQEHWFGTNFNGQDIFSRTLYSTRTAFEVGFIVTLLSVILGALLGSISGYYSGTWIDEFIIWIYGCLDAIPFYLFVAAISFAMQGYPFAMHVALVATIWTSPCKVIRAQVIKLKHQEFVEAAKSIGVSDKTIIFRHILPNTTPLLLIEASIIFVTAIKTEAILSFLGLGVKEGISWGVMLSEASTEVVYGIYNNFFAASSALFILVMAFNLFSDALQDALDPKKVTP
jgi:ABC-type dipeptide/oligopeptide/nickel transport system permease subunit